MEIEEYANIHEQEQHFWWYVALHNLCTFFLEEELKNKKHLLILDAGCGTGGMLLRAQKYGDVSGFDFSQEALKFCRMKGLTELEQIDINVWEADAYTYDVILSLDVLCHKAVKNDQLLINRFYKALKKDGILILNLPAFDSLRRKHDEYVHSDKRYTKLQLKEKLQIAGFSQKKVTYRLPFVYLIVRFQKIFALNKEKKSDVRAVSPFLNKLLILTTKFENRLIRWGISIPFGSSVFSVSRKLEQ